MGYRGIAPGESAVVKALREKNDIGYRVVNREDDL